MVGGIDHVGDLGYGIENRRPDSVGEGCLAHCAALTAATHRDVGRVLLDTYQGGKASMRGQRRVDSLFEQLGDLLGHLTHKVEGADVAERVRPVGVAHHQPALTGIAGKVQGGTTKAITAVSRHQDRQITVAPPVVVVLGLGKRDERQVVDEVDTRHAGNCDAQRQRIRVVLAVEDLDHLGESRFGDLDHLTRLFVGSIANGVLCQLVAHGTSLQSLPSYASARHDTRGKFRPMNETSQGPNQPATIQIDDGIAVIDFDDGKANVLGHESIASLLTVLDTAEDEGADAVVIVGRPGRFSAGFDLKAINAGPDEAQEMLRRGVDLFLRLYMFPRPVVAACTGHAIAAGAIILLTCDLRVGAGGDFKIGLPELTMGMSLPFFATELARDRISKRHLTRATALGTTYDPVGAVDSGFLDEVVDPDEVLSTAIERAAALTGISRGGLVLTRGTTRGAIADSIRSGLDEDLSHFSVGA